MILRGAVLSDEPLRLGQPLRNERSVSSVQAASSDFGRPAPASNGAASTAAAAALSELTSSLGSSAAPLTLEAVSQWISQCNESARRELALLLASDLEPLREQARVEGFAAGERAARAQIDGQLAAFTALIPAAESAFKTEAAQLGELCTDIVAEALTKITGPLLGTREAALGTVLQVLQRVKDERDIVIRVSAADLEALEASEAAIDRALSGRKFALIADSRVEVGGCIVESALGALDGRLETQLRGLFETVRAAKSSRPEPP